MKYLPQSEPATRLPKKWKVVTTFEAEAARGKTKGLKQRRHSTRTGDKMSNMELVFVKPLKAS
jgi:hypothetical protein